MMNGLLLKRQAEYLHALIISGLILKTRTVIFISVLIAISLTEKEYMETIKL